MEKKFEAASEGLIPGWQIWRKIESGDHDEASRLLTAHYVELGSEADFIAEVIKSLTEKRRAANEIIVQATESERHPNGIDGEPDLNISVQDEATCKRIVSHINANHILDALKQFMTLENSLAREKVLCSLAATSFKGSRRRNFDQRKMEILKPFLKAHYDKK